VKQLVARVRGLLFAPRRELAKTVDEPSGLRPVLVPYVLVLAAIGPLAHFISLAIIGHYQRLSDLAEPMWVRAPGMALLFLPIGYGLAIGGWFLYAVLLAQLAPSFGGRADRAIAFKTAALSATPVWIAGVLALGDSLPFVGLLAPVATLGGLVYAVLLGAWAVPLHLHTPEPRAVGHALAALGITIVVSVIAYWLLAALVIWPFFV
jgi:hypothetical protein